MTINSKNGYVKCICIKGYGWYIESIIVNKDHRGHGIGTDLMNKVLKRCGRPVYLLATSELGSDMKYLFKFYEKFGFKKFRIRDKDFPYNVNMILDK